MPNCSMFLTVSIRMMCLIFTGTLSVKVTVLGRVSDIW